jgi:hypothetical protein
LVYNNYLIAASYTKTEIYDLKRDPINLTPEKKYDFAGIPYIDDEYLYMSDPGYVSIGLTVYSHNLNIPTKVNLSKYDIKKDSEINILDINIIAQKMDQTSSYCTSCDVNGDGKIDMLDLKIVLDYFGSEIF